VRSPVLAPVDVAPVWSVVCLFVDSARGGDDAAACHIDQSAGRSHFHARGYRRRPAAGATARAGPEPLRRGAPAGCPSPWAGPGVHRPAAGRLRDRSHPAGSPRGSLPRCTADDRLLEQRPCLKWVYPRPQANAGSIGGDTSAHLPRGSARQDPSLRRQQLESTHAAALPCGKRCPIPYREQHKPWYGFPLHPGRCVSYGLV
jgi:hypothetical protein